MQLIVEIVNIVAGLILAMGILPNIPAVGKDLERLAKWLGSFQTVIGIVAIVVGIDGNSFKHTSLGKVFGAVSKMAWQFSDNNRSNSHIVWSIRASKNFIKS